MKTTHRDSVRYPQMRRTYIVGFSASEWGMDVIFNDFPSVRCPTGCYSNVPSALFSTSFFSKCNPLTRHYHFIKRMTSKSFIKVPSSLHLRKHKAIFCWQSQHLEILSFLIFILNHFHSQRNDIRFTICEILSTCSHNDPGIYQISWFNKKCTKI